MTELLDEDLVVKQVIDRYLFFNRLLYTQILKQIKKFQVKYLLRKLVLWATTNPNQVSQVNPTKYSLHPIILAFEALKIFPKI